jgi:inner membrane protein
MMGGLKFVVLGLLLLFFLAALQSINGVVTERQRYRDQVIADVASGAAKEQTLFGPVLIQSYEAPDTLVSTGPTRVVRSRSEIVLLPESLTVRTAATVEVRHRGIYKAQVFKSGHRLVAVFLIPPYLGIKNPRSVTSPDPARWIFGVSDPHGLHRPPLVRVDGTEAEVEPGTGVEWVDQGFRVTTPSVFSAQARRVVLEMDLDVIGTNHLGMVPLGGTTRFEIEANWPHPSFEGGFLPDERSVTDKGFHAVWQLSRFGTGVDGIIAARQRGERDRKQAADEMGVRFLEPVDVYQQSQRATKYGMLFVLLTFVAFFMLEVLKGIRVHPMQYGLTGAALSLFFLILISLTEHVPFVAAYLLASAACVGLIAFYVAHVLGSAARGLAFGGMLALLYALLYVILQSVDYALLLGTLLLFGVLAFVMIATRGVNWYEAEPKRPATGGSVQGSSAAPLP